MEHIFTAASRFPAVPSRADLAADERADYDYMKVRTDAWAQCSEIVGGQPYGYPHFSALLVVPGVAAALSGPQGMGLAIRKYEGQPGFHSRLDHEMVDLVLAFDSEYWALIAWHMQVAVLEGVRLECIEALAAHRDSDLSTGELQVVEFIRAVRDGQMTDQIWNVMLRRLGSERGVVMYVSLVLCLFFHHRFCWAVGAPEMGRDEFHQMLREYRDGTREAERAREYKKTLADARQLTAPGPGEQPPGQDHP